MLLLRRQRRQQQQQLKTEKRRQKIYGSLSAHFRLAATCAAHNGRQTGTRLYELAVKFETRDTLSPVGCSLLAVAIINVREAEEKERRKRKEEKL